MQRSIDAPDREWLSDKEASNWLNIPESTLLRLANEGVVPGPKKWNKHERRWHWEAVVFISWMLKYGYLRTTEGEAGSGQGKKRKLNRGGTGAQVP
jgi:hypothetical protein